MAKKRAPTTRTTEQLVDQEVPYALHQYQTGDTVHFYGREIADSLGIDPARVFEALITSVQGKHLTVVVPTSSMLDLPALAAAVGSEHGKIVSVKKAEKISGFAVTGISPIGLREPLPTIVDISALDFPTVFISAGQRGYAVELSPDDLVRLTNARTAPIAHS